MLKGQGRAHLGVGRGQQPAVAVFQRDVAGGGGLVGLILRRSDDGRRRRGLGQSRQGGVSQDAFGGHGDDLLLRRGAGGHQAQNADQTQARAGLHWPVLQLR